MIIVAVNQSPQQPSKVSELLERLNSQFIFLHICMFCQHAHAGSDDDLEYYVRECGAILGVSQKLPPEQRTGKHILEHIFTQIVEFKKLNQVHK